MNYNTIIFIIKIESDHIFQFNENNDYKFGFKYFVDNESLKDTKHTMISVYIHTYKEKEKDEEKEKDGEKE